MSIGRVPGATGIQPSIVDAKGDLIVATAADSVDRLAVGTNEQRLVADSAVATGLKYVADTTNYAIAAKGDLLVGTAADTVSALTVGSANQVLTVDSSTATGLKWAAVSAPSYTWTSYTPTYNNFTLGNGSQTFGYLQIDKIVFVRGKLNLGSTSTVTGQIEISVPVSEGMEDFITTFQVSYYDNSAAIQYSGAGRIYAGFINLLAFKSDATYLTEPGTSGTVPITFGTSDVIIVGGWYQAS